MGYPAWEEKDDALYPVGAIVQGKSTESLFERIHAFNGTPGEGWITYAGTGPRGSGSVLCGMRLYTFVNGTLQPDPEENA